MQQAPRPPRCPDSGLGKDPAPGSSLPSPAPHTPRLAPEPLLPPAPRAALMVTTPAPATPRAPWGQAAGRGVGPPCRHRSHSGGASLPASAEGGAGYGAVCFQHPTPEHLLPVLPRTSTDPLSAAAVTELLKATRISAAASHVWTRSPGRPVRARAEGGAGHLGAPP